MDACGSLAIVPALTERIRVIAELLALMPESHVLVVTKNNKEARSVGRLLKRLTGRLVRWHPNPRAGHPWVHCIGVGALPGWCVQHWGFIVFLDAEMALSKTAIRFVLAAMGSIRIAFLTHDKRHLHQSEFVALEEIFGPVIYRPGSEYPSSDVSVAWLPFKSTPTKTTNVVEHKRKLIWSNDQRNLLIASAARALSDNNLTALNVLGLGDAASAPGESTTAAIVVENVEHGQQLSRWLRGWRLEGSGYSPGLGQLVVQDRVILTLSRASEMVLATRIVIYAAGGHEHWLDQIQLVRSAFAHAAMLIVDVADHSDARSTADTKHRAAEYSYFQFRDITGHHLSLKKARSTT